MNPRITIVCILALLLALPALSADLPDSRWIGLRSQQPGNPEVKALSVSPSGATIEAGIMGFSAGLVPPAAAGTDTEAFSQLTITG
jgi:hypothetical protein